MKTKRILILMTLCLVASVSRAQVPLKVTGGIELAKGNIQPDVLMEVIQQKQEEVFNRLFANLVIEHFRKGDPKNGVYNFPTYFALYNIMTDMTIGKSKTTVSQSIITNATELAYVYAFAKYFQEQKKGGLAGSAKAAATLKSIDQSELVQDVEENGKPNPNEENLLLLNYYLDAAFEVLAKDASVQSTFKFKRSLEEDEIAQWYDAISLMPENPSFTDISGNPITFQELVGQMKGQVQNFLAYSGSQQTIAAIAALQKNAAGFTKDITDSDVEAIKLTLLELGVRTDYLFSQNVVKTLLRLIVENTHIETDPGDRSLDQVYVDVEALILSLDKEFISKNKKSSVASRIFFINPRPFFTIGTSTISMLKSNTLGVNDDGSRTALHNINLASEKIGFRVKLWDGGYTRSFGPGQAFKFHGTTRVWEQPQKKPMVSSLYYNAYVSGLLYNLLDLKTNQNFDYGLFATNVGVIFFNGLELSVGYGLVYDKGFSSDNGLIKIDFDIPIVDYLAALKRKQK